MRTTIIHYTNKKVLCKCSVETKQLKELTESKTEDLFDFKKIEQKFFTTLSNSNFRVMKCYKLIIDIYNVKKNIGQIIMTILFGFFVIIIFIFIFKGNKQLHSFINIILHIKKNESIYLNNNKKKNKGKKEKKEKKEIKEKNYKKGKKEIKEKKEKKENESKPHFLENSIKRNSFSPKGKYSKKHVNECPPKKKLTKSIKNIFNKNKNKHKVKHNSSINPINNNILLNVQLINTRESNLRNSLYNPNNNNIKKPKNKENSAKKKNKPKNRIIPYYHKRHSLNVDSNKLFNKKKEKKDDNKSQKIHRFLNDYELNNLEYIEAIRIDQRKYIQYYWSLLKQKQIILFTFVLSNDYNVLSIKIALLILNFSIYFTINGFFFNDKTMHKSYIDNGAYDILYKIPYLLYSTMISVAFNIILRTLSLSQTKILEIKEEIHLNQAIKRTKQIESNLKLRFILFFIIGFLVITFCYYFISCFCAVFVNTQIILIEDTIISFCFSLLYPFGINLIPGIFRILAIRKHKKNYECIYKIGQLLALI